MPTLRTNNLFDFRPNNLQHNQFSCTIFISKGNDGSLVMTHCNKEDVYATVEYTHLGTILHAP